MRLKSAGKTQQERDRIALGRIESYLDSMIGDHFQCPSCKERAAIKDVNPIVIQAMKLRYDKLRPALSSVEQTTIDVTPAETDLAATIRSVLQSNPELRPMFLALIQDNPDVKPDDHGIH